MTIIRDARPTKNFAQISNSAIEDTRITWKAKGVLVWLLSRPTGWRANAEDVAKAGIGGRDLVRGAMRELESAGYLVRRKTHDPVTGRWRVDLYVTDVPDDRTGHTEETPGPENPALGHDVPTSENVTSSQVSPSDGFPGPGESGAITRRNTQEGEQEGDTAAAAPADAEGERDAHARTHDATRIHVGHGYTVTPDEAQELRDTIRSAAPGIHRTEANAFWWWFLATREPIDPVNYLAALHERAQLAPMIRRWRTL